MKICEFCGTANKDDALQCVSCGANSFKYKCNNCGTEFSEGVHCPHCGVKAGQAERTCPVCNTKYYTAACPTCGYIPSKQNTVRTAPTAPVAPTPVYAAPQPVKPKRKTWLWVLGWIFIFPLPLTLILLKKDNMKKGVKYGIIIAAWVLYLVFGFLGGLSEKNNTNQVSSVSSNETAIVTEAKTN